jgi:hypothetical protein
MIWKQNQDHNYLRQAAVWFRRYRIRVKTPPPPRERRKKSGNFWGEQDKNTRYKGGSVVVPKFSKKDRIEAHERTIAALDQVPLPSSTPQPQRQEDNRNTICGQLGIQRK